MMRTPHGFEEMFLQHRSAVHAYARRRVPPDVAEEIVAETFAVAWRRFERVPVATPLPWLYAVAGRVIANERRAARRRGGLMDGLLRERIGSAAPDPALIVDRRDGIADAFAILSDAQRQVLGLTAWEGLDPEDAARALGISAVAYRVRLHRARRALAQALEQVNPAEHPSEMEGHHGPQQA